MLALTALQQLGPYAWFIVGAIFLIAEVILPGVNLIWFGAAATLTGLVMLGFGLSWQMQMAIFLVAASVSVLAARFLARRQDAAHEPPVNRGVSAMVGRELALAEPIVNGVGRALYGDGSWRVAGRDQPAGTRVRVVGVEASTLLVEPVDG